MQIKIKLKLSFFIIIFNFIFNATLTLLKAWAYFNKLRDYARNWLKVRNLKVYFDIFYKLYGFFGALKEHITGEYSVVNASLLNLYIYAIQNLLIYT